MTEGTSSGGIPAPPLAHRLVFLGSGTSTGVPMLGCDCAVCRSDDPRDKRMRPSVLFRFPGGDLLVDTTPELRLQLLRAGVGFAHAIAYTHAHADHLFGLDDARLFPKHTGGAVSVYCEQRTEEDIRRVFPYAFDEELQRWPAGSVPKLHFVRIAPNQPFQVLGQTIIPFRLEHGPRMPVLGFRVGGLAYCTDVKRIPEESLPFVQDLDVLVLDALRHRPHPTHFNLAEALATIERLKPRRAILTHLSHEFDHAQVESGLPESVRLAYDGLTLDF